MIARVLDMFVPGATIYLPGATGEIAALATALMADPGRMVGVHVISCLLPGMNLTDYAALADDALVTCFLLPPELRASFARGRVRLMPLSYSQIARHLACSRIDVAIAHVAPPGPDGRASFGIAADFSPIAWAVARRRVAIVNPAMPAFRRGPSILLADADVVVEAESALIEVPPAEPDPVTLRIAASAAGLIPDGASIQVGIGAAPAALWARLTNHRDLRLRSGMAAGAVLALDDAGALAPEGHLAGIAAGTSAFYHALADRDLVRMTDTRETHDMTAIGKEPGFNAINSALSVDLFGQVNLEWQGSRPSSGVGGAPDFVAAALASVDGRAITMLPATARGGTVSRIVTRLDHPTVSLPRSMADTVVTENGIAELRYASLDERAARLIAVAAPEWREPLEREWHAIRGRMN